MITLIDKIFLIISCSLLYFFHLDDTYMLVPLLIAIIISCFNTYVEHPKFSAIIFVVYLFMCMVYPNLTFFLPVVLYDVVLTTYWRVTYLSVIPIFVIVKDYPLDVLSYLIILLILTVYARYKSYHLAKQKQEYRELRDTTKEVSLLLEEKNRNLLEKQDYEINLATLNERNRISKEIHDNIGHLLSRSLLQIGALLTIAKDDIMKNELANLKQSISDGMDSIRASIHNMHNESIDLYGNLENLIKDFTLCPIKLHYDVTSVPPTNIKYCIIAVVKESLSNIIKHSDASNVVVQITEHPIMYQIIISDNGTVTKETEELVHKLNNEISMNEGIGLVSIIERVRGFEGKYRFSAKNGFQTFITLPKNSNTRRTS